MLFMIEKIKVVWIAVCFIITFKNRSLNFIRLSLINSYNKYRYCLKKEMSQKIIESIGHMDIE